MADEGEGASESDGNVHTLEMKLVTLESEVYDLKYRVIENEQRAKEEKKRKRDSKFKQKFKQQRLPAWQPILTADTVLPAFFLIGLLFIPLGVALLHFSNVVKEEQLDYTDCNSTDPGDKLATGGSKKCADIIDDPNFKGNCSCEIEFNLTESFPNNVYMYYGMDNFYQNHRRYVKSRNDNQLAGKKVNVDNVGSDCAPFNKQQGKVIAPCGAIANSLFNDTFSLTQKISDTETKEVVLLKDNISWPTDKSKKFINPVGSMLPGDESFAFKDTEKPIYWTKPVWQLDMENASNNGYQNEDLIVWMRTAAFPNFRKLYRRISNDNIGGLSMGKYVLKIEYNYPVSSFSGRKRMILSTTSFLGGKNNFLGIAYITVGAICLVLGVAFLIIHIKFGKRYDDDI